MSGVRGLPPPPGPLLCSKASVTGLQPDGASSRPVSPFLQESGHSQASGQPWTPDTLWGWGPRGSLSLAPQAGEPAASPPGCSQGRTQDRAPGGPPMPGGGCSCDLALPPLHPRGTCSCDLALVPIPGGGCSCDLALPPSVHLRGGCSCDPALLSIPGEGAPVTRPSSPSLGGGVLL